MICNYKKPSFLHRVKGFFANPYHRIRYWLDRKLRIEKVDSWLMLVNTGAWLGIVLQPLIAEGKSNIWTYFFAFMMLATRLVAPIKKLFSQEENVPYRNKRRIKTANCIDMLTKVIVSENDKELSEVRRDILECIVGSVREYRCDFGGVKIYSNLLIRIDDEIVVVSRNDPSRKIGCRYKKNELLCNQVFDTSLAFNCGDVLVNSNRLMEYRSFMALPIIDYENNKCLAVVTIDSVEPYHFDDIYNLFDTMLRPYTRTLAMTFVLEKKYKMG